ncbi:taste receptor type 1 member 1 [Rhinatrema bivittatum]|uniref:taste receptor type 1 member 1 n=1 Tax=Rhinatrema bivittatum TaxID=194408 RepID=UPI0011284547|nr:taste receptor type 1 member 1 [Rhinatrema bivittatum]
MGFLVITQWLHLVSRSEAHSCRVPEGALVRGPPQLRTVTAVNGLKRQSQAGSRQEREETAGPVYKKAPAGSALNDHGFHLFQAMRFSVEEINNSSSLLPNVTLGYEIYDICSESSNLYATLDFVSQRSFPFVTVQNNFTNYQPQAIAVIGPDDSDLAFTMASILGLFLIPQISYEATNELLSVKDVYPSFLRTIPSDKFQVEVLALLLRHFNWTWIAILGSDNDYGRKGMQSLYDLTDEFDICVAYQAVIPSSADGQEAEMKHIVSNLAQYEVQVVVVFATKNLAKVLFEVTIQENATQMVWLGTEDWLMSPLIFSIPNIQRLGTVMGISVKQVGLPGLREFEIAYLNSEKSRRNSQTVRESCNQICRECQSSTPQSMPVPSAFDLQASFNVYAAVYAVGHALHGLLDCESGACNRGTFYPWQLLERIRNINFILHNQTIRFDEKGDPYIGYDIAMWEWTRQRWSSVVIGSFTRNLRRLDIIKDNLKWHTEDNKVPVSVCSKECPAGEQRVQKGPHPCCFDCKPCPKMTFLNKSNLYDCQFCTSREWSPPKSHACFSKTIEYLSWTEPVAMVLLFAIMVLFLLALAIAAVFALNLNTPVVRSAGGKMCFTMLGSLACACCTLFCYFGMPTKMTCMLRQPMFAISYTICLSCLVIRSFQVVCIFKLAAKFPTFCDFWVKKNGPNVFLCVSSVFQVMISIIWISSQPSVPIENLENFDSQIVLECSESISKEAIIEILYIGLLSIFCFVFCYLGKDLPENYNEAKCITFSLLIYFISWISFFTIYIVYKGKYVTAVNVLAVLASLFGILGGYFVPKCYVILLRKDLNTPEHFQTSIQNYTRKKNSD